MVYTVNGVNYTRRKKIPVTGAGSGAQTDFQIKLATLWADAMQAGFGDVRFTKADFQTLIDAWLESKVDSTSANIWAEFPNTPADGVEEKKAYMYYGNTGVASDWDGDATFINYDKFDDLNDWTTYSGKDALVLSTDYVKHGTYSAKALTGLNECVEDRTDITNNPAVYSLEFYDNGSAKPTYVLNVDNGTVNILGIQAREGSTTHYNYRRGATWSTTSIARSNGWHSLKFEFTGSLIKYYIDDTLVYTSPNDSNDPATIAIGDYWGLEADDGGYGDDFIVRKYAANPPTAAFGTEEHQRRTPMMM